MKKKKIKKKVIIIIIVILLLLIVGIGYLVFINSKKLKVEIKNNNKINVNTKLYNTDLIKIKKNGKLISKKTKVDTSKIGKKKITIKVKDYFNKTKKYVVDINIIDKEKPTIKFNEKITITEGEEVDLLKEVEINDNSKEDIKVEVEGDYDVNTPGTYNLEYVAKDSSGNETKEKFVLEVNKKEEKVQTVQNTSNNNTQKDGTFTTSNGHHGETKNGITYIDGVLIANKTYSLPSTYNPGDLTAEASQAFNEMANAAASEGISLRVVSGFRSYNYQNTLYNNYVARDGKQAADTYSARPGHSEHQTGLGMDINLVDNNFGNTREGQWLAANAWKYGFILRYPQGKTNETGYMYESWHFRLVGKDLAKKLYNNGDWITLESYFGITSEYSY